MTCAEARLDEYLDGELSAGDRAAVEGHLSACAACRGELERSRRLEAMLRGASSGEAPDPERFLASVKARSRVGQVRGWVGAAAAALLLALGLSLPVPGRALPGAMPGELVRRYSEKPSTEIEERIRAGGTNALLEVERLAVDESAGKVQFAAATLLFKLGDGPARERVVAWFERKREGSESGLLAEPGLEAEDAEMVPVAISLALEGQERWAFDVLHRLNRLNSAAQRKIVDSVVTLLHSTNGRVQKLALDIVNELDIEFPLAAIVELLDSPELGAEALRFLKRETGQDHGSDKAAWARAIERN